MSTENLENRVAELENAVRVMCHSVIQTQLTVGQLAKALLGTDKNITLAMRMILDLRPELRTDKTTGAIHNADTQTEFSEAEVEQQIKVLESLLKSLPPSGSAPPPPELGQV